MKALKFEHPLAQLVEQGKKHITWRIDDDKDLQVNDTIRIIDKISPRNAASWKVIGTAKIRRITEKRLGDITSSDQDGHEKYSSKAQLLATYRGYYGDQVNEETPVKIIDFAFTPGYIQQPDDAANIDPPNVKAVRIYADGGSRGNPGPSASGYVVSDLQGKILAKDGVYLGRTTNNQAEYHALKFALEKALELKANTLDVYMDSQLVVNQMNGIYKIKNKELLPVYQAIKELQGHFKTVKYTHIPRELNKQADTLVNEALDAEDV